MPRSARLEAELAAGVKTCTRCKAVKPLSEYGRNGQNRRTGTAYRDAACRSCTLPLLRAWWDKNRHGQARSSGLKRYGLTLAQYEAMLAGQNGVCAICGGVQPGIDPRTKTHRRLAVDHNHKTGKVRGLLCTHCNQAIGQLKEDPELLRKAAAYIQAHA